MRTTKNKILIFLVIVLSAVMIIREQTVLVKINSLLENSPPIEMNKTQKHTKIFPPSTVDVSEIRMWMDIPNAFPWRHCIEEYNNIITLLRCSKVC